MGKAAEMFKLGFFYFLNRRAFEHEHFREVKEPKEKREELHKRRGL